MVNITDLGEISGEILIFGGPYSNLQATTALMDWADLRGIAKGSRICTGDVVAYCGDAEATLAVVRDRAGPVVAGNCERQLAAAAPDCGCGFDEGSACSQLAIDWYAHALATVSAQDRAWMGRCPDWLVFSRAGRRFVVIHGGATDVSRFIWANSFADMFAGEFDTIKQTTGPVDTIISGHSGLPFQREFDDFDWINAGVIGMPPHDGTPLTRFVILSDAGVSFHKLVYDHPAAARAMIRAGLTQGYHQSLSSGYWPSEDILPQHYRR